MHSCLVSSNINPLIEVEPNKINYEVGSDITLFCSIIHSKTTKTAVNLLWLNSFNHTLQSYPVINGAEHTINYTISNVKLSDAGQYTCSFYIKPTAPFDEYIKQSVTKTNSTKIKIISKLHLQ